MILLLSNERDLTTDYIVRELRRRGIAYFRLNSERLSSARVRFDPRTSGCEWEIDFRDHQLRLEAVAAAYFRRPVVPNAPDGVTNPADVRYCREEWLATLHALYGAIGDRWLNSPARIEAAENKPLQLVLAKAVGLDVADTLLTNDPAAVAAFLSGGPAVAKPLRTAVLDGSLDTDHDRVIFTTRIPASWTWSVESIEAAPVIYQREVIKRYDIRVTVVGEKVFAAAIASQDRDETAVDWRRDSQGNLPHAVHALPSAIAKCCVQLVQHQGLRFAAIDLILDRNGGYWFLESNPNGQWAWIEARTGLPIAATIVDELLVIAGRRP